LGVFGSYVRGDQRSDSDLDLLVEFQEPPSLFQFIRLENELSDALGIDVDLVMKSALKPAIGRHILEEVQAI
jgi:predicted nucleotidyltransferase